MIPAGQSGKLEATVTTKMGRAGRQTKSISVETDAPDAQRMRLSVTYNGVTFKVQDIKALLTLSMHQGLVTTFICRWTSIIQTSMLQRPRRVCWPRSIMSVR